MLEAAQSFTHENICLSKSSHGTPSVSFVYDQVGQKNYKAKNQNTKKKQNRVKQRAEKNQQTLHLCKNTY